MHKLAQIPKIPDGDDATKDSAIQTRKSKTKSRETKKKSTSDR